MSIQRWIVLGRMFMCLWVLFAAPTVVAVLQTGFAPVQLAVAAGFTCWAVVWVWFWGRALGRLPGAPWVGLIANAAILGLFGLIAPEPQAVGGVLVFVFIIAGCAFPLRQAAWLILGLAALQVVLQIVRLEPATQQVASLLNSVLVGGVGIGARLLWEQYRQLHAAREQLANLAVTEERLRFARDLHDVLGQSLSVLVLKSELVAKQLPAAADDSLRNEVRDIALVARKSLNDVRETVSGYRQATLQTEISSARTALRSAGIGMKVEDALGALPPQLDGVLAWCLREAVTNVVKHSGAKRCEVRLTRVDGEARLEVTDDGRGATSLDGGSGLTGMQERVNLAGGTLRVGSENGGGLHVLVSVPEAS